MLKNHSFNVFLEFRINNFVWSNRNWFHNFFLQFSINTWLSIFEVAIVEWQCSTKTSLTDIFLIWIARDLDHNSHYLSKVVESGKKWKTSPIVFPDKIGEKAGAWHSWSSAEACLLFHLRSRKERFDEKSGQEDKKCWPGRYRCNRKICIYSAHTMIAQVIKLECMDAVSVMVVVETVSSGIVWQCNTNGDLKSRASACQIYQCAGHRYK